MMFLWETMTGIYGYRWTNSFGLSDKNNIWRACLKNISDKQLKSGFDELLASDHKWPPSAIEFRALCLKQSERELGVLSAFEAYTMLTHWLNKEKRKTSDLSPFLYAIYKAVGHYALMNESHEQIKRSIREACEITTERVKRGEKLELPPEPIDEAHRIEVKLATPERAASAMRKILKVLGDGV